MKIAATPLTFTFTVPTSALINIADNVIDDRIYAEYGNTVATAAGCVRKEIVESLANNDKFRKYIADAMIEDGATTVIDAPYDYIDSYHVAEIVPGFSKLIKHLDTVQAIVDEVDRSEREDDAISVAKEVLRRAGIRSF